MCFLKHKCLSIVIPSNSTWSFLWGRCWRLDYREIISAREWCVTVSKTAYIRLFNKQENITEKNIPSRHPRIDPWGIAPSNISPVTTLGEKTFANLEYFRESLILRNITVGAVCEICSIESFFSWISPFLNYCCLKPSIQSFMNNYQSSGFFYFHPALSTKKIELRNLIRESLFPWN